VGGFLQWTRIFGLCIALLIGQVFTIRVTAALFQGDGGLGEYLYTLLLLHVVLGMALLPVTGLLAFPHTVAWRGWLG